MVDKIEPISLVNKLVRTEDAGEGINNTAVVSFMYPNFITKNEVYFDYENNVIYTGKYHKGIKEELSHGTKNFICISNIGMQDIDFTDRETVINILYSKFGKKPKEEVQKALESMNEDDFWSYFKHFWVTGHSKLEDSNTSIFHLYMVLGKQRHEILQVYFKLKELYPDSVIFSSVLSFIEKSLNLDEVTSQSGRYIKLLQDFNRVYSNNIIPIIQRVYVMKCSTKEDKEYRTLWLLMQLGKGAII